MMTHLREFGQGFGAKIILALLVGSFVLWGIGDVFRQGGAGGAVATVAHNSITTSEYLQALRHRQEELRQMLGSAYKPGLLKKLGIEKQVLYQLINTRLIDKEADSMGIEVGDDEVIEAIRTNSAFADHNGHFSKELYEQTLKNNNIAEARYVADVKKELAAKLLTETLAANVIVPDSLTQALYRARAEQRIADLLIIPASMVLANKEPSDKEIESYYKERSKDFTTPETRTLSYVTLKLADIQSRISVPDEDVKRIYNERLQDFHKPETRELEQMLFEKKEDADAAEAKLAKGDSFANVAAGAKLLNKDKLALGEVSKQDVPAEAAGDIFALKAKGYTRPVQTAFGWHIFHVVKITPESTLSLEQARGDIEKDLSSKEAQDTLYKLVTNLEDALAGGSTLENAARQVGANVATLGPVTRDAMLPSGKKADIPAYGGFLDTAFSVNEKDHSQPMQADDGSYYLIAVDSVQPEHERPLAEVKKEVAAALVKEQKGKALTELAGSIATELGKHKTLAEINAEHHVTLSPVTSGRLNRSSEAVPEGPLAKKPLPRELVLELFRLKPGESTHAYGLADGTQVIATNFKTLPAPAKADAKITDVIEEELKKSLMNERLAGYLIYLQDKYRVTINNAALSGGEESGE